MAGHAGTLKNRQDLADEVDLTGAGGARAGNGRTRLQQQQGHGANEQPVPAHDPRII